MLAIRGAFARLRRTTQHEGLLLAGLAVAILTMFDRTIWYVLQIAAEVEQSYGVRLVPALVVLIAILVIHLQNKRQQMRAAMAATALRAQLAEERAGELKRIADLGEVLATALTMDAIRVAVCSALPEFVGQRPFFVVIRTHADWETLVDTTAASPSPGDLVREEVIERFRSEGATAEASMVRVPVGLCVVRLLSGTQVMGLLAVSEAERALTSAEERVLTAIASLLAIASRNVQMFATLHETALTDALTGCYNRAHLIAVLDGELRRGRRTGAALAVIVLDLDGFKALNDTRGHAAGDAFLAKVGAKLRGALRRSDVRCRLGGDEFAIVLPDTYPKGAAHVAETLRRELASIEGEDGRPAGLTASFGVASATPGDDASSLLHRADIAQYRAKGAGGNQIAVDFAAQAGTRAS